MSIINDIFRQYAPQYLRCFGDDMPNDHRKVIHAIMRCRSEANGSVVHRCPGCHELHVQHRSCGNRHCPGCQHHKGQQWLAGQLEKQLPGHHFLLTCTVPAEARDFFRQNQRLAYAAFFAATAEAIKTLAADPRSGPGDIPGFFGVLHTWGRQLQYHPHIHYVVPGGLIDSGQGIWHPTSQGFYLPVKALSRLVRGKFRDRIAKAGLLDQLPPQVWCTGWNVNCQPVGDPEASLKYLTPYVFRVAIANSRIIKVENDRVFFNYRHKNSNRPRVMDLDAMEFIRRFLQHVLPSGFMKVRYYGFLSPTGKISRQELRARIELAHGFELPVAEVEPLPPQAPLICRHCGTAMRWYCSLIPQRGLIMAGRPAG